MELFLQKGGDADPFYLVHVAGARPKGDPIQKVQYLLVVGQLAGFSFWSGGNSGQEPVHDRARCRTPRYIDQNEPGWRRNGPQIGGADLHLLVISQKWS